MNPTNIEYLTHTWNPLAMRCTPIGEGCAHCWHIQMANRLAKNPSILFNESNAYSGLEKPYLVRSRLEDPLKRKKPARIGVQFMGDLFHHQITYEQRLEIFHVIAEASWHTLLILTKRPQDMFDFIQSIEDWECCHFQHVWWGVSISSDKDLWMLKILLQIPAAKRFVSIEPMLGPVDLTPYISPLTVGFRNKTNTKNIYEQYPTLDWVIAGCESGPKRRPAKIEWFRDLKKQCVDANVPFFLKQWEYEGLQKGYPVFEKMPYLDGKQWNEMP